MKGDKSTLSLCYLKYSLNECIDTFHFGVVWVFIFDVYYCSDLILEVNTVFTPIRA